MAFSFGFHFRSVFHRTAFTSNATATSSAASEASALPINTTGAGHTACGTTALLSNIAAGDRGTNPGVLGLSSSPQGAGVRASGSGAGGTALEISTGGIKVTGAGLGTDSAAFVAQVPNAAFVGFSLNNSLTNGDPNAILIVTPSRDPSGVIPKPVYVRYIPVENRWALYTLDLLPFDSTSMGCWQIGRTFCRNCGSGQSMFLNMFYQPISIRRPRAGCIRHTETVHICQRRNRRERVLANDNSPMGPGDPVKVPTAEFQ